MSSSHSAPSPSEPHSISRGSTSNPRPPQHSTTSETLASFKWAPPPQSKTFGTSSNSLPTNSSSSSSQNTSFAPPSRSFVPRASLTDQSKTSFKDHTADVPTNEEGNEGSSLPPPPSSQRRTNSNPKFSSIELAPPPSTQKQQPLPPFGTAVRSPLVRPTQTKEGGSIDLSRLKFGRADSPLRPPLRRNLETSRSNHSPSTSGGTSEPSRSEVIRQSSKEGTGDPHIASTATAQEPPANPAPTRLEQLTLESSKRVAAGRTEKRALSNDNNPLEPRRPGPVEKQVQRSNSARVESADRRSTSIASVGGGGGAGGEIATKKRKISNTTKQNEVDAQGVFGAVSEMIHNLKARDIEIFDLKEQLEEKSHQVIAATEEKDQFKKELTERTRLAVAKVEQAHRDLSETCKEAKEALRASKAEVPPKETMQALLDEVERLKKEVGESVLGSGGRSMLEKNEEARIQILRELQDQLVDRDRVIKLLRSELESRTGELSESRDTTSLLSTERHVAYTRIDHFCTELEENRKEAQREKKVSREELDKSTAMAREQEQRLTRQVEETVEKWTGLLFEAKKGEEAVATELKELRNKVETKEEEINHYDDQARSTAGAHAEEKLELTLNLKIAREEANQAVELKERSRELENEVRAHRARVQSLLDSAQRDQDALRSSRAETEHLRTTLARKTAEVEGYETQLPEIKSRLAAAESLQPELDHLRGEKALLVSQKQDVARELANSQTERSSLSEKISELEESLVDAKSTSSTLQLELSSLIQQLTESKSSQNALAAKAMKLESKLEEEIEKSQKVEEELREHKESCELEKKEFGEKEKKELRLVLVDEFAKDKMGLQNENKRLRNQLEDKTRRLNRAQNDLAEFQGKNVLNPNSSSCGSAASSEIASRAGGGVVGSKSIEEGGNEMSGGKDGGFISGGPASEVSEELSHEADKDWSKVSTTTTKVSDTPTDVYSRLRKRSLGDENELPSATTTHSISKTTKRTKRTISNENDNTVRNQGQESGPLAGGSENPGVAVMTKPKPRGLVTYTNKYNATTRKKK